MEPIAHGTRRTDDLCCWPECYHLVEHPDVPLCEAHFRTAGTRWLGDNIAAVREAVTGSTLEAMLTEAAADARARLPQREAQHAAERAAREAEAVVYYLRVAEDRVKIGYTTNLRQRLSNLRLDMSAVLATEPGGRVVERARHRKFADERYGRREDFALSDRLAAHIDTLDTSSCIN